MTGLAAALMVSLAAVVGGVVALVFDGFVFVTCFFFVAEEGVTAVDNVSDDVTVVS